VRGWRRSSVADGRTAVCQLTSVEGRIGVLPIGSSVGTAAISSRRTAPRRESIEGHHRQGRQRSDVRILLSSVAGVGYQGMRSVCWKGKGQTDAGGDRLSPLGGVCAVEVRIAESGEVHQVAMVFD
jgi:hypothetical protein